MPTAYSSASKEAVTAALLVIGGFHVSGTLSMLKGVDPDLERAKENGVALFAGEAEGRLEQVLQDAAAGVLEPLYDFMDDLPGLEGMPIPLWPPKMCYARREAQPVLTLGAAAPTSARFAQSSMCKGANPGTGRLRISRKLCASITPKACVVFSSLMTILPATKTGG